MLLHSHELDCGVARSLDAGQHMVTEVGVGGNLQDRGGHIQDGSRWTGRQTVVAVYACDSELLVAGQHMVTEVGVGGNLKHSIKRGGVKVESW